ncbi:hydroxyethylthiazole kinase [Actinomycetaceae bacterium WB03_NA08]|uniref:Hydroxyethylthiazole kinase n=1 Tax=Scrofimicrobium canadense TaxID=2652290 RepID=A0A6N7W3N2_9ACTO|nr:hydroxyethylthiazole kinase [Scrofimicrobium canadense]MSS84021.1 hydroxyethylthiazole kinase [Scrofimicrobium canadense]
MDAQPITNTEIYAILESVRRTTPLIQCITNNVTVNFVANTILAVGGAPAMVDIPEEAEVFAAVSSALYINLGTVHADQRMSSLSAARTAKDSGVPWVLDPVAVGMLPVRTALARKLLSYSPTVIRGNASEILALAGHKGAGRGVETGNEVDQSCEAAMELARQSGATVSVSGPVDLITDGNRILRLKNGTDLFTRITGAGCALGGVVAAFCAVAPAFEAAVAANAVYAVAGELAASTSAGPGTFQVHFLDALASAALERDGNQVSLA